MNDNDEFKALIFLKACITSPFNFLKEYMGPLIGAALFIGFIVMIASIKPTVIVHEYHEGDILCMKITNEKVQVIESSRHYAKVLIRFQTKVDHKQKYDTMYVEEYELGECQ